MNKSIDLSKAAAFTNNKKGKEISDIRFEVEQIKNGWIVKKSWREKYFVEKESYPSYDYKDERVFYKENPLDDNGNMKGDLESA